MIIGVRKCQTVPRDSLNMRRALGMDFDVVAAEVEKGFAECWEFEDVGHAVTRLEHHTLTDTKTLVIVAAGLSHAAKGAASTVLPLLIEAAEQNGCTQIRAHTESEAMGRYLLRKAGFAFKGSEYGRKI